ncbi:MAG: aminotransferase class III-fold pyridoxal phosphate-dependent enzyme, partial [Chitinophagaceae bacterium]
MNLRSLFLRYNAQTSDAPIALPITRAEGVHLFDDAGKAYIDLIGGISVCNMGHGHPAIRAAIHEQVDRYMHVMVYGELVQSPQVLYAQSLCEHLPSTLQSV